MLTRNALTPRRQRGMEYRPFTDLQSEINRLFDGMRRGFDLEPIRGGDLSPSAFHPKVDIGETENSYKIRAELPGLEEKEIELTLSEGTLTLKGEKKFEHEEKKSDVHVSERAYGSFHRSFALPKEVDIEKVTAVFDKGVLTVTVPKSEAARDQVKKVSIKKG